jgi:hypothetical protein
MENKCDSSNEYQLEKLHKEINNLYDLLFSYSLNKEDVKENLNGDLQFDICRGCKCHNCSDLKKAIKNSTNKVLEELAKNLFTLNEQITYLVTNGKTDK